MEAAAAILLSPLQKLTSSGKGNATPTPRKRRLATARRPVSPILNPQQQQQHQVTPRGDQTPGILTLNDGKRSRKRKIKSRVDILEEIENSLKHMRREKQEYFEFKKSYYREKSEKDARKMHELKEINCCLKKLYEKVCPPSAKSEN